MTEEGKFPEPSHSSPNEISPATSGELIGSALAEKYGFYETETLRALREEAIQAFKAGEKQKYIDLLSMYADEARRLVTESSSNSYPYGQLGLMLAEASFRRDTGRWPEYIEDLQDALDFCIGQGYADAATNVELLITHAQEEAARLLSE